MMYEILKGLPMPQKPARNGRPTINFNDMDVGDQIKIPNSEKNPPEELSHLANKLDNVRNQVSRANRKHKPKRFECEYENGTQFYILVWRAL